MDAVASYSFANLAWLGGQAVPLIIWPSFIGSLLRSETESTSGELPAPSSEPSLLQWMREWANLEGIVKVLETYFARSLGLALLSLGLVVMLLSGVIPLTSAADDPATGISPYANAALTISMLHHASAGFYCYTRYSWTGQTGFLLGCLGSSVLATLAMYCVMFAGDGAMTSRYHKFDQSTSGFPFKNSQSYRAKKKAL